MIYTKILDDKKLIEDACALLYEVHVVQGNWQFEKNNPSKLRIEQCNGKNILIDRFTEKAIWFGIFDNNKLIGCTRITFIDENQKLEVEGYTESSIIAKYLPKDKSFCVESTRTAISPKYTGKGLVRQLLLFAFKFCNDNKYSICATVSNVYLISLLKKIGFPLKIEQAFKYEKHDPTAVNFYFADYANNDVINMIKSLEKYKTDNNFKKNYLFKMLETFSEILPIPIYWQDLNGVVIGLNVQCLKAMGANRNIIGKNPYDFYPKETAEYILKHNEFVIKTGEILSQDEKINDLSTGKIKIFRNIKAPLYDDEGKIIGIIGSAMDVTLEKEAQRLKLENANYQAEQNAQKKLRGLLDTIVQAVHKFQIDMLDTTDNQSNITNQLYYKNIKLSKREEEVLYLLAMGKAPKDIASILGNLYNKNLSPKTIASIINKQLYTKVDASNYSELIDKATKLNLIKFMPESLNNALNNKLNELY